jgi:GDP-L-fucose synthase
VANEVERFLFLGSSYIHPKLGEQPIRQDALLTGPLEETNEGFAIAKLGGSDSSPRFAALERQSAVSVGSTMGHDDQVSAA